MCLGMLISQSVVWWMFCCFRVWFVQLADVSLLVIEKIHCSFKGPRLVVRCLFFIRVKSNTERHYPEVICKFSV